MVARLDQRAVLPGNTELTRHRSAWRLLARAMLVVLTLALYGILRPATDDPDAGSGLEKAIWAGSYIVALIGLFVERRRAWQLMRNSLPLLAFLALLLASSFWSDYHDISLKRGLELAGAAADVYFIVVYVRLRDFVSALVVAAGSAAFLSVVLIVADPARGIMQEEYAGAWQGVFTNKNSLGQGMAMGVAAIILVAIMKRTDRRLTVPLLGTAVVCTLLVIGSQSATSVVVLLVLVLIILSFLMGQSTKGRQLRRYGLVAILLATLVIAFNFEATITLLGRDSTFTGRTDIWPDVLNAIGQRPILGYGYDTFWLPDGSGSAYMPIFLDWTPYHAHDGFLELLLDAGASGVGAFLILLVVGVRQAWTYVRGQREVVRLWPLLTMVYFVSANITEASIGKFDALNWFMFMAAVLYAAQPAAGTGRRRVSRR